MAQRHKFLLVLDTGHIPYLRTGFGFQGNTGVPRTLNERLAALAELQLVELSSLKPIILQYCMAYPLVR
jgi:hypothetical protein